MPLSDHEQRMLDQIESALYAEDPKFASSVRGGGLRAPTARRRLQGVALFVLGLGMLVSGVAFRATWIGTLPILSIVGFVVMFGGVVFGRHRPATVPSGRAPRVVGRRASAARQGRRRFFHQPHGRSVPPSLRAIASTVTKRAAIGCPFCCAPDKPISRAHRLADAAAARHGPSALTHCAPLRR